MLQRASHIRTKQCKWLEQSLHDMDEKAHDMLKLIEEEGDSFAKRAEMIEAVEDSYLAFKALADRYDILSKELQNANNTIETVFPEQVQLSMDADDDYPMRAPKTIKPAPTKSTNVPKVPKASMDSLKGFINNAFKQFQPNKIFSKTSSEDMACPKPTLKDRVNGEILALQTIKELTLWLEQRVCLKDELKHKFTLLCNNKEEITTTPKEGVEADEIRFKCNQAAKLQGEILSMKQENNKVREELQTCLGHVSVLQLDIEKTLRQLNQEFNICTDQPQHKISRVHVPLHGSFIFGSGTKVKKKKSLFNFMHAN